MKADEQDRTIKTSRRERIREEIVAAARGIILSQGHEAVTVRSLAAATGYTHTNLYYYFRDLESLLGEVRLQMISAMIEELNQPADTIAADPAEALLEALWRYVDYFLIHPTVFRFFYFTNQAQAFAQDQSADLDVRFRGIWQDAFARLIAMGIVDADEIELLARTLIYALQGMILLNLSASGQPQTEVLKAELKQTLGWLLSENRAGFGKRQ